MFSSVATDLFQKSVTYPERFVAASAQFALSRLHKNPVAFAMAAAQFSHWSFDFISVEERKRRIRSTELMIEQYPCSTELLLYAERLLQIFIDRTTSSLSDFGLAFLARTIAPLAPSSRFTQDIVQAAALEHGFSYEHLEAIFFNILQLRNASKHTIESAILSKHPSLSLVSWERLYKIAKADGTGATVRLLNEKPAHKALLWIAPKRMQRIETECLQAEPQDLGKVLFESLPDSLAAQWVRGHADLLRSEDAKASIFQAAVKKGALFTLEAIFPSLEAKSYASRTRRSLDFQIPSTTLIETEILLQQCGPLGLSPQLSSWVDFISRGDWKAEPSYVSKVTLAALEAKTAEGSLFLEREGWIQLSIKRRSPCASPLKMMSDSIDSPAISESVKESVLTDFSATILDCGGSALYFSERSPSVQTPCSIANAWSPYNSRALALFSSEKPDSSSSRSQIDGEKTKASARSAPIERAAQKETPRYTILKRPAKK